MYIIMCILYNTYNIYMYTNTHVYIHIDMYIIYPCIIYIYMYVGYDYGC